MLTMPTYNDLYLLGVDGGGTKTLAKLINTRTQQAWLASGGSASLTNNFDEAISVIKQLCHTLVTQANCQLTQINAVFGLAGADNDVQKQDCYNAFDHSFNKLHITSDAKTSVYGANLGKPIVVVALGTGSVGMCLDEKGTCTLTNGWGFLLGDEGSGAKLGLHAVKAVLGEIQSKNHAALKNTLVPESSTIPLGLSSNLSSSLTSSMSLLAQAICRVTGESKSDIIQWGKYASPADFASFSPDVFSLATQCPQAKKVIDVHISNVEELIEESRNNTVLPIALLGGLAASTAPLLSKNTQALVIPAMGSALDGACLLAKQL